MNFVADESLDFPIITALRQAGHDVYSIKEQSPRMDDEQILKIAKEHNRILLTSDKDFGELVFRLKLVSAGIVLLRLSDLDNLAKVNIMMNFVQKHGDVLQKSFCVITSRKIRVVSLN